MSLTLINSSKARKSDINFNIKLVQEFQKHPWLYDISSPHYTDVSIRRKSWEKIARFAYEYSEEVWSCMDSKKKQFGVDIVRKRWKNIKNFFIRHLEWPTEKPVGSLAHMIPHLDFLIPFVKKKELYAPRLRRANRVETLTTPTPVHPEPRPLSPSERRRKRKKKSYKPYPTESIESQVLTGLKDLRTAAREEADDYDKLFLMSQMPHIRKMSTLTRFQFEMEFVKLVQSYGPQLSYGERNKELARECIYAGRFREEARKC
ncbi:Alcohol dehydrogenase transcription factor Myb/SANT-like [Nesidiocoris tenuis]|uniref:Alcohol dehydrogenase transcription factor Myb/SANT-like n=1 Tax=Nesidiocoris tenuis TaxID=355587 RepID=A0ABN7B9E1_9HEMI|nr:Alcohol dehydrogenase transcription factor Myb/SANT-like [Nesidiocoris tenuis]